MPQAWLHLTHVWMSMSQTYEYVTHKSRDSYEWSCDTYESVMPQIWLRLTHMNESCRTRTNTWRSSRITRMDTSCHKYEWVTARVWTSHVACMNESCHTYEWVMPHKWMRHGIYFNESQHIYRRVMSHVEWVMLHIWISHITNMNQSPHSRIVHGTQTNKPRHTHKLVTAKWHTHEWVTAHTAHVRMGYVTTSCKTCAYSVKNRLNLLRDAMLSYVFVRVYACMYMQWDMSHLHAKHVLIQ